METAQPCNILTADAPFNDPTDSVDLVIRTADNIDFFVLSGLLSLKSPSSFFRHVLLANQHTEEREGLPVLEVKEDGDTFRIILLLCYPYTSPEIKSIKQLAEVGTALKKYCMDNALERFVQTVLASSLIREQPVLVFVHAVANGWKILGEAAARHKLAIPLVTEAPFKDLKRIDAFQYTSLRYYHILCNIAVQGMPVASSLPWLKGRESGLLVLHPGVTCQLCGYRLFQTWRIGEQNFTTHSWFGEYLAAVKGDLSGRPFPELALGKNIIARAAAKSISECNSTQWPYLVGDQIFAFATLVAGEIERLIAQVPLNIDWTK
ncbi:hypothetical protein IW261DRAFT_1608024 [Armillaria novae-zelandiae]|uniref:BTB domain-containing protein n=1 Tax=Armillaria novae-zelandiae TaxID=153914 RepID=A0AA39P8V6_9AGAR|nr:hypothetical protein IW261DRAFT_1608024 [Armillaria novae-zelandiae]